MTTMRWLLNRTNRLNLVAGLSDGILTALTLAAGKLLGPRAAVSVSLALRVAAAAAASGAFVFFVAHYAVLRGELVEAERQLNLTEHGRMIQGRLGQRVLQDAIRQAFVTSVCSFCGAFLPLLAGVVRPIFAIVVALAALAALGAFLGKVVHGQPLYWGVSLCAAGSALCYLGVHLRII